MDLSSPLRSLVPSLDSAVLEVLSRSKTGLGPTQLARLAGRGTRQGIQLVLDRLVEHGLVVAEPTNRGHVYSLNRDHLLTPAVLSAARARQELFKRLADSVTTLDPAPLHASLFGSFARGDGDESSDIDLLIVLQEGQHVTPRWEAQMRDLEDQVLAWTGNRLETLTLELDAFRRAVHNQERIIDELLNDAHDLSGLALGPLVTATRQTTATR
ncbi:nucleotidyltransferase domain-containing protein [Aeromicrobium stalagmiti]|uniref:nucleotidyltransferase domain-containing protein n=1 Tax=Aeromicrobium stalagmiti TaxID=2738988 RepID=UPI0015696A33|nr:nucleotidyltransferase domain-containing protein [Aeromicrobium stalagmiti]NRQ48515.1 nucleotidyltransferase domain-containing protein [Aeromicrobium stalagmiti]